MLKSMHKKDNKGIVKSDFFTSHHALRGSIPIKGLFLIYFFLLIKKNPNETKIFGVIALSV